MFSSVKSLIPNVPLEGAFVAPVVHEPQFKRHWTIGGGQALRWLYAMGSVWAVETLGAVIPGCYSDSIPPT